MKKIICLLLSGIMCFTMIPSVAFAGENAKSSKTIPVDEKHFPDANFRKVVRQLPGAENGKLSSSEIKKINVIFCDGTGLKSSHKISSLKGIEYFTELETLFCYDNKLKSLDVSKNRKLINLDCSCNRLKTVKLNKAILNFDCRCNELNEINVKDNNNLQYLYCDDNYLRELDVSRNPELSVLWCSENMLKKLNISKNTKLERVYAVLNNIVYINTSRNRSLKEIYYIPREVELDRRTDFKYTRIATFDKFLKEYSRYFTVKTSHLKINKSDKTISLTGNYNSGLIQFKDGDSVKYEFRFVYDKNAEKRNFDVKLDKSFRKVNSSLYKRVIEKKPMNVIPVVTDKDGKRLVENADYEVEYSDNPGADTGKILITVKGKGNYYGTAKLTLVVLSREVSEVHVRPLTNKGGYDDAYITWNRARGADGYKVYARRPKKTDKWTYLGSTKERSFLKKDLYDGWKYEFRVIPYVFVDGIRYGNYNDYEKVSMTTLIKVSRPSIKKCESSRVNVSWKNISGESGYQLKVSRKGNTKYFRISDDHFKLKVIKKKKYTYKVRAYKYVKKSGNSYRVYAPWSDERSYTLK